jgi:hypothetical protein
MAMERGVATLASSAMKRRMSRCLPAVLIAFWCAAAVASADTFDVIFRDYQRTGRVDACKFSAKQLADAKRQVPNDVEQYAPDFAATLEAASELRAAKRCGKTGSSGGSGVGAGAASGGGGAAGGGSSGGAAGTAGAAGSGAAPAGATAAPGTPGAPNVPGQTPAPAGTPKATPAASDKAIQAAAARRDEADGGSFPLAVLIVLGALTALGLLVAAARWWAWEPRLLVRSRHAGGEAGWRMGAAWSEFADWVRLGR